LLGENIGRHQLDSHIAMMLRGHWYTWENIAPEFLGKRRRLEFSHGKVRRGRAGAIQALVERLQLSATDEQIVEAQDRLRAEIAHRGTVTDADLEHILREVVHA
jgi:isopropylmalate/homocitrate/citramalate synthase